MRLSPNPAVMLAAIGAFLLAMLFFPPAALPAEAYDNGYGPKDTVPVSFLCLDEDLVRSVAGAAAEDMDRARGILQWGFQAGRCMGMPGPIGVQLQERLSRATDIEGDVVEVWRVRVKDVDNNFYVPLYPALETL